MKFEEAKQIIKQKYNTRQDRLDVESILIDKHLKFATYYYIILIKSENEAILTDYAETCHIFYKLPLSVFEEVCKKHNIDFREGYIEKKFESIEDVDNFVKVLDELSAKYAELEEQED